MKEVISMMRIFYVDYVLVTIGVITSKITFLILILSYIWMGNTTSTEMIFYVLSLFQQLTTALGIMLPISMGKLAMFRAAFIRLNKMLQAEELEKFDDEKCTGNAQIEAKAATVKIEGKEVLKDITFEMNPGLTIISGLVGAGKSSLLKLILRDYPMTNGKLNVIGRMSYASQEPWLFPSSIKQNILFGEEYDKARYKQVLKVSALEYDLSLLDNGDETIVADRGQNLSKGQQSRINLARAVYRKADIYLFDDSLTALDRHVQEYIFNECIQKFLKDKLVVLVSQNSKQIDRSDYVIMMDQGTILSSGKPDEIDKRKLNGIKSIIKENVIDDVLEEEVLQTEQQFTKKKVYQEKKKEGKVDLVVYKKYIQYGGGFIVFSLVILLYILAQSFESVSDKLLSKWIDLQQKVLDMQANSTINATVYEDTVTLKDNTFGMYTILTILKSAMGLVKYYAFLRFCRNASIRIHNAMSSCVVNAEMKFFDNHFIGNILNRFSYDLNNIDESLPFIFPMVMGVMIACMGGIILIATVNWLLLLPCSVFLAILVLMRTAYIPTSRSLKRLEAATRSPLVGHINSSMEGITTVRAFKAQQILKNEFDKHQDLYTSALFTLKVTMTAFGFFMDFVSLIFTILIISRFLFFDHGISAGSVGLVLTQVFMLTDHLQWAIRQWAQLENHMTSVERALEYTDITQEDKSGREPKNWPTDGAVTYNNVSLHYENTKAPVIRNVTFQVKPKEKIGIVGRTGAGKSSVISTLFRLYDCEGKIEIDRVDIKDVSLKYLRNKIAIIPQDPILFSGTIRENIDPSKTFADNKIWETISKVKIKDIISSLDMTIQDNGSNFSSGQKQLICLARAVIGNCKIVVLDEATANMDPVTDKMLHAVIDEVFSDCTILTIAHRLQYILDCDKVIVMDNGELVECNSPKELLQDQSSLFYKMCKQSKKD
ncbi:unnamed protein product [Acanthoscelides obtectus]|uniref:Uncharacterized protein n=1 Tax=Acanthoscelides obtectus TaxID=200917 RepID=A0A9P0KZZ5_ACAOB|nr:unnamed protein product [Acanthoscelides obtectus]CAK1674585.1 Probable multidrug resistance-associated protein lethal(2)03659 [Acanthoscelides obtectus]